MPPKPWETQKRNPVSSEEIKSNSISTSAPSISQNDESSINQAANLLDQTSKMTPQAGTSMNMGGFSNNIGGYSSMSPYSSSYGSYGSSLTNRYGSSYGSSYGGYGGYGSYGGSYGGYGGFRGGMMNNNDPNNSGILENSMRFLDSFNYVVNSLSEVARNLEMNADGLGRFWISMFRLVFRFKDWIVGGYTWIGYFFYRVYEIIKNFIVRKLGAIFFNENKEEWNLKIFNYALKIGFFILVVSFVPAIIRRKNGEGFKLDNVFDAASA